MTVNNSSGARARVKSQPQNSSNVHAHRKSTDMDDFQECLNEINRFRGSVFFMVRYDLVRHLKGDGAAACVLSHLLNLLYLASVDSRKNKMLHRNELWLECPFKDIQEDLSLNERPLRTSIKTLVEAGLLETRKWVGNVLWLRVIKGSLDKVAEQDQRERISEIRYCETQFLETAKRSFSTYKSKKSEKNTLAQGRERENLPHFLRTDDQPTSFGQHLAKEVIARLLEANKLFRKVTPQSRASWARQFDLLAKEVEGGAPFVEEIVRDHLANIADRYQPQCYSAIKIRRRFDELVQRKKQRTGEEDTPAPEFTERRYKDKNGRTIIECVRTEKGKR